ncbi:hypothetical protein OWR29_35305 [Actinoplanes sp. Pm04-4]|uniref:Alpha/beta hydrolase n=1 Tax=Paractinoplanes pyxinae TaxID=2997416 RepID=A0ABT4BCG4_9ACTN|nr:hypothetical protein [Actinoplanes pyxinae]MCY1143293.1 hypothetical protein [Actinoplanes pyxinae]
MRVLVDGVVGRTVLLFGAGSDPGVDVTWGRGVTLAVDDGEGEEVEATAGVGVVGVSVSGLRALAFAGRRPEVVDRVVLVRTPIPEDDGLGFAAITAKTLLLYGRADARHAVWWQKRLPAARLEVNPDGHDDLLVGMWHRVLSHVAPRCKRPA